MAVPSVRHTYGSIDIAQRGFEQLVCENASGIIEAEQAVVGENGADTHVMSM